MDLKSAAIDSSFPSQGTPKPAYMGSQSSAPGKEQEGLKSWENVDMDKHSLPGFGSNYSISSDKQ